MRLLHLNTQRRTLFMNTNSNITIAIDHIYKIIKLIFETFALQEFSLKMEECRCFLLLKIIGDLIPTSTLAMPS